MSENNIRLKLLEGSVNTSSVLLFNSNLIANSGENLVTQLVVSLPNKEILESYRVYFEFLLPNKTRFISEPCAPAYESVETVDELSRQPIVAENLIVRYNVPRAIALIPGNVIVNIKATNDSVTVYKSKTTILTVEDSVNSENDSRYYDGDLLDYLVMHKPDGFYYEQGWLHAYTENPTTKVKTDIGQYPINPLFEDLGTAADWAMNDEEATPGQLITAIQHSGDDPYAPLVTVAYLINPDKTLTSIMTSGNTRYDDLIDRPTLDTTNTDGTLVPLPNELISGKVKLARVAKTGKLSDIIGDMNYSVFKPFYIRDWGEVLYELPTVEGYDIVSLASVVFNTALVAGSSFVISLGNNERGWRQLLSTDDIDVSIAGVSYSIDQQYQYELGDKIKIVTESSQNNISIDVYIRHS